MLPTHRNSAIILAFLAIPFGVAIYQDATATERPSDDSYDGYAQDDSLGFADPDPDSYDELDEVAEYEEYEEAHQAMGATFFDTVLFAGGTSRHPVLSGPLAGLVLGESTAAFEEKNPSYYEWTYDGLPGFEEATLTVSGEAGLASAVVVDFPDDGSASNILFTQWGPPVLKDDENGRALWLNDTTKVQAQLTLDEGAASLEFSSYTTLSDLINPGSPLFGFEKTDLFALSPEEVKTVSPLEYLDLSPLPSLWPTELPLYLDKDETITAFNVDLELAVYKKQELMALLKTKLGEPTFVSNEWRDIYLYRRKGRVVELAVPVGDSDLDPNTILTYTLDITKN